MNWTQDEFKTLEWGNQLAEWLSSKPIESIHDFQCLPGLDWAETQSAYPFWATHAPRAIPEVRQIYIADREADILALRLKTRNLEYAADYLICC